MAIEKEGATHVKDIRDLVKLADEKQNTLVINMDRYIKSGAVVVVATGKKASLLRKLAETFSEV
jgi:hypothetical protein